jgi:cold shock CspA family protein
VVESYDPATRRGVVLAESDRTRIALGPGSLSGSIFRSLSPGQRILFELSQEDGTPCAVQVRVGSDGY